MPETITKVAEQPQLLKKVLAAIGELPTSPAVVSTVMGLTADLNTEVNELSRVLSGDPALTAKVLRLSNSPFYGRSRSVGSLNEAVLILGFYTIRSLVVASSTYSLFGRKAGNEAARILWDHSLAVAMAARIIARRIRHKQIEEAFIVGLLHDIGKLILSQKMPEPFKAIVNTARTQSRKFFEIERDQLGFDHGTLGSIILSQWNFPPGLVETVAHHHQPREVTPPADGSVALADIVFFANEMATVMGYGFIDNYEIDLAALSQASLLKLDEAAIAEVQSELATHYDEEKHLFEE